MTRDSKRDRLALLVPHGEAEQIQWIVRRIAEDRWIFQYPAKDATKALDEVTADCGHGCFDHALICVAEQVRLALDPVELIEPLCCAEEQVKAVSPRLRNLRATRQKPIDADAQRKEQPQVDRLGGRDGLKGRPLDLHSIWVEKQHSPSTAPRLLTEFLHGTGRRSEIPSVQTSPDDSMHFHAGAKISGQCELLSPKQARVVSTRTQDARWVPA